MGYSVLYIAFGIVALWLLGEVLLQYKARLRWRLLAFAGFMGVVAGVASRQVVVIVLGAVAFGAGQALVTLSYKRGFSTGWALGGRPGSSRRRKGAAPRAGEPVLAVTPVEEEHGALPPEGADVLVAEGAQPQEPVYRPEPLHDDSGEYPLYDGRSSYTPDPYTSGGYEGYGAQGYEGWGAEPQPAAASYDGGYQGQGQGQGQGADQQGYGGWGGQDYGYDPAAQQPQPAAAGYDGYGFAAAGADPGAHGYGYGPGTGTGAGDWTPSYGDQAAGADPYAAYGYDPQAQPYVPQQQAPAYEPQPAQSQSRAGEYADPYDPYRY